MTSFIVAAALLTIVALGLLLIPLARPPRAHASTSTADISLEVLRDQLRELEKQQAAGQIDAATAAVEQRELERRAVEQAGNGGVEAKSQASRYGVVATLLVPVSAALIYWMIGNPAALRDAPQTSSHQLGPQQIAAMVAKLSERLQQNPADAEGWLMLGKSYTVLGRHGEAAAAYGRAASMLPPDAGLFADYADVLAMAQGRRLAGDPERLIARALEINPNHVKSLALSGSAAFERRDFNRAIADWEKILTLVPGDSGVAKGIRNSIADARAKLGDAASTGVAGQAAAPATIAAAASTGVAGTVALDPGLERRGEVKPDDVVFIFARASEGGGPPLAILRTTAARLPTAFSLDDSMAMAPNRRISQAKQVVIGARVAKSGDPLPKPGDWEGYSSPVAIGSGDVRVLIGTQVR